MSPRIHRFAFCLGIVAVLLIASTANAQLKFRKIGSVQPASNEAESDTSADKSKQTISSKNPKLAPTKLTVTNVSSGSGVLPREHNQKWREYDIRPYTSRVTTTERPEQAVIDWVLRETGTEVWFTEPFGILNASKDTLRVYHTDEMHAVVRDIVDRVVSSQAESYAFGIRLLTVGNPNWRAKALPLMQSVTVQSPGVDAWLLSKENATILLSELRKRTDFREHNSPNLMIHNGQSQTISAMRPRSYTRSVRLRQNAFPACELEMGQIQEGYSLQISPLLSLDERNVEVVLKCQIDQVEKLIPVSIDVPTASPTRQKAQVQVPQMVSWRLHERFRWPTDQVLLLSCGVVATPTDERSTLSLPKLFTGDRGRADALLLIESNGKASQVLLGNQRTADRSSPNYRGRY